MLWLVDSIRKCLEVFDIVSRKNVEVVYHYPVKGPRELKATRKILFTKINVPFCVVIVRVLSGCFSFFCCSSRLTSRPKKASTKNFRERIKHFLLRAFFQRRNKKSMLEKWDKTFFFPPFRTSQQLFFVCVKNWKNFSRKENKRKLPEYSSEAFSGVCVHKSESYKRGRRRISNTCKRG